MSENNEQPNVEPTIDDSETGAAEPPGSFEVEALRRERDELKERQLRALADLQNYRRRAELSIHQAREVQLLDIAKALVTVMDHFDRALEVDPAKASVDSVLKGLQIVHDELLSTLQRYGVERFEARTGDPFDPSRHEAMMRQKVDGVEPNHVGAQFQPGYRLGDKTVRPAKVTVTE